MTNVSNSSNEIIADLAELLSARRRFKTVYADPPWSFRNNGSRVSAKWRYPTMSTEAIARLPVSELVDDDAFLFLWTTSSHLFDAKQVIDAWKFNYVSSFVWLKTGRPGMGNYFRICHEFLLVGRRGKAKFRDHGLRSWIQAPRLDHSQKPEAVRRVIEEAHVGPYIELFARAPAENWTVWGNQIDQQIFEFDQQPLTPKRVNDVA